MTESEWLECTNPWTMLEYVRDRASERKLRLFACASCRRLWHLLTDESSRQAVEVAEQFADKLATAEQLHDVAIVADGGADDTHGEGADVADTAADLTSSNAGEGAHAAATMDYPTERPHQANIFRDLFDHPFRPISIDPTWLTLTVTGLATAAYEERIMPSGEIDIKRLTVLSDALEEAGCQDADLLDHLRSPGPHVRGCWAVDLLLKRK